MIEEYVSKKLKHLLVGTVYAEMEQSGEKFSFLPGHNAILSSLPACVQQFEYSRSKKHSNLAIDVNSFPFSFMMKEFIRTAMENYSRDSKHQKFSSVIQHFATYIYMHCGK